MNNYAFYFLLPYLYMFLGFAVFLIILKIGVKALIKAKGTPVQKVDKGFYYREIPCQGRIDLAYWLLYNFSNLKKEELHNGLLCAYLLSWYRKGYVDIKNKPDYLAKQEDFYIDLQDGRWVTGYAEQRIYDFLKAAAGKNNILEKKELQKYCSDGTNQTHLKYLFKSILSEIQKELLNQKKIMVIPAKDYIIIKTEEKITLSEELQKEYQNLMGLKNFFTDYSAMEEKRYAEVALWEDYLIFANLLGVADKVKQQFRKLCPKPDVMFDIFEVTLDNTLAGHLNIMYKAGLMTLGGMVLGVILVAIVLMGNEDFTDAFIKILAIVAMGGPLLLPLYFYWKDRKIKDRTKKTYARITNVESRSEREWDSDGRRYYWKTTYSFDYEYKADGTCFKGHGFSDFRKRKNQRIKIYYSALHPQNSETAGSRNYMLRIVIFIIVCMVVTFGLCYFCDHFG